MAQKFFTSINLNKNELQNAVLQNLASHPSSPKAGQKYYNTTDKKEYIFNGTEWIAYDPADPTILRESDVVDNLSSTSTIAPLSAAQGKALNEKIGTASSKVNTLEGYFTNGSAKKAIADKNGKDIAETYVTRAGSEDVTGVHDFTEGLKIGGNKLESTQDDVVYLDANLHVRGSVTMFADGSEAGSSILDNLPVAGTNTKGIASFDEDDFQVTNGHVSLKDGVVGLDTEELQNYLNQKGYVTSSAVSTNYISKSQQGAANGVASLDASGKVPSSQLPSYVDDVLEYANKSSFPASGESGKIYVDISTNLTYRWSGSTYVEISSATIHKYAATLSGNGSTKDFTITHSLGTRDVVVNLYESISPYQQIWADVKMTSTSQVTVTFAEAPASGTNYRIVIIA